MTHQKKSGMISWLLMAPLKFALIMFIAAIIIILGTEIIANATTIEHTQDIYVVLITVAMFATAAVMIRDLSRDAMSRKSFIATINAQTVILFMLFIGPMMFIAGNADMITFRMLRLSHHGGAFALTMSCVAIYFLYVTGLAISALYAKFRRSRTIGIPAWKIICSIPFGFPMIWVPGYLVPEKSDASPAHADIYSRITQYIVSHPAACTASFTVLALLSGLFYGINMSLLTLAAAMVMYIWIIRTGADAFKGNIAHTYSTCAVAANVAIIVMLALMGTISNAPATTSAQEQIVITSTGK